MKVNPPAPDAVIVIFGAAVRPDGKPSQTLRHRVEAAALFGSRFSRPLFIPTGGQGRFHVLGHELTFEVLFPKLDHFLWRHLFLALCPNA